MAESLGEAILELRTNSRPLEKGLRDAEKGARSFTRILNEDFKKSLPAILGVAGAIAGVAAAYGKAIKAAAEAERVSRLVDNGVRKAGEGFGLTSKAIKQYAADLQVATGIGDDAILESSAILLSFRRVQGDTFREAQRLALDMSTVLGTDLKSTVIQLGKALEDPKKGITALARSGTTFTEQQKDMIEKLVDSNQLFEAQKLILAEVESQYGGAAAAVRDTMGGALNALKEEWGELLEVIGDQSGGGVLRTAVESWISSLRSLREFLPQISIGFFEMFSNIARKSAQFLAQLNFAMIATLDNWRRFFDTLGMDRQASAISGVQAAIMNNMAPQIEFLTDLAEGFEIKSQEALDAWIKGAPDVVAAGGKIADVVGEVGDKAKELTAAFLVPLEVARTNPLDKWIGDAGPKAERLGGILEDVGVITKDWGVEIAFVRKEMTAAGFSAEMIERAVARIGNKTVEWGNESEKVKDAWADINKGFSEAVGRGLHDAAKGFLTEMSKTLTDDLPSGLKPFGEALVAAANEWLIQMLANIVKAKAAAKGIGAADGGDSKQGGGWWSAVLKAFKGGGGGETASGAGLSGSAIAGIAAFAVLAAAVAAFRHQRSKRDKQRFGTDAAVAVGGSSVSGAWSGKLDQTGPQVAQALQELTSSIIASTRGLIDGVMSAQIKIRNDKKAFEAIVKGEIIGTFRTANEAIVAAAKKVFESAQGLDPLVRQVIENFEGTDPQALANAVARVQEVSDVIRGITDIERNLQDLPNRIRAVVFDLQMAGVAFADAVVAAGQYGVSQFRDAWRAISGIQLSPEEERAMKERQRALLLAQLKLEKVRIEADISALKAKSVIVKAGGEIARQEIITQINAARGRAALLETEADLTMIQLGVWNEYLNGRADFVEQEASLFQAELDALGLVLAEIDKLIAEVSVGKIKIGGSGKGPGIDLGSTRATGGVSNWHQRMLDALDKIKEFQRRLVFGELSPFTGREKVSAAKATYDRLVAQLSQGGRQRVLAMEELPDAAQQYLELFRSTFGSTGQYGIIAGQVNDLMSSILRGRGIEPAQIAEQAAANANAIANSFAKDRSGRLETRDEALESQLDKSNRTSLQMAISMARVVDLLEDQNNRPASSSATASGAALSAPRPPRRLGAAG